MRETWTEYNDETGVTVYVEYDRYGVECYALDDEGEEVVLDSFEQREWIERAGSELYDDLCEAADHQIRMRKEG